MASTGIKRGCSPPSEDVSGGADGGAGFCCGRIRASIPRPRAFLGMLDNLLCKKGITGGSTARRVVLENVLPVGWRLGQAIVTGNHGAEDLRPKIAAQIGGDLLA